MFRPKYCAVGIKNYCSWFWRGAELNAVVGPQFGCQIRAKREKFFTGLKLSKQNQTKHGRPSAWDSVEDEHVVSLVGLGFALLLVGH